jgi:hypothetical protein
MEALEIPLSPHEKTCWACSIPQLTWAKLALLNMQVSYSVNERSISLTHPSLYAAENARQALHARYTRARAYLGLPVNATPIKHTWRATGWGNMTEADWDKITTQIAEEVMRYQYSFLP